MGCFGSPFLLVRKRNMELHDIRGVGAKTEELFRKVGIETPSDLIRYYPGSDEGECRPLQMESSFS